MTTIEINGKEYQLDIDKAKELGLLKEKDNKPRSWEEYEDTWVCLNSNVTYASDYNNNDSLAYDIFNSKEEARAFCALGKLIQLRDAWWGDWKPDWRNDEKKCCIYSFNSGMRISDTCYSPFILAFPTKEMATDFLETFRNLTEEAKMFL